MLESNSPQPPPSGIRRNPPGRLIMTNLNELIVDSRHVDEVRKILNDFHVWSQETATEENEDLQLTLITKIADLDGYAARTRVTYRNEIAALKQRSGRELTDLDVLMYEIRGVFALTFGYLPALGKNRDTVIGYPQHKGFGDPLPASAPAQPTEKEPEPAREVTVGVVDTPLLWHESFPPELVTTTDPAAQAPAGGIYPVWTAHATFVVGKIREQAPAARIVVKAGLGEEDGESTVWDAAKKIAEFRNENVDVLNLSFGTTTEDGEQPLALRRAIERVQQEHPELLVVAAAGNRGGDARPPLQIWPAAMTSVNAVGSTKGDFTMKRPWVDLTTDGLNVNGPYVTGRVRQHTGRIQQFGGYATWSGTSFAAATITGELAKALGNKTPAPDALQTVLDRSGSVAEWYVYPG
jgi:hypothetical protein